MYAKLSLSLCCIIIYIYIYIMIYYNIVYIYILWYIIILYIYIYIMIYYNIVYIYILWYIIILYIYNIMIQYYTYYPYAHGFVWKWNASKNPVVGRLIDGGLLHGAVAPNPMGPGNREWPGNRDWARNGGFIQLVIQLWMVIYWYPISDIRYGWPPCNGHMIITNMIILLYW